MFTRKIFPFLFVFFVALFFSPIAQAQTLDLERGRHRQILSAIKSDIKKHYYDPTFRGIDIETRFKAADEKLQQANTIGQMSAIIAQVLIDFNDSHLFFAPPGKVNKTEYGFEMQMIGGKCFVTDVKPESDAAQQGLKVGDEIYSLEKFAPTRESLWKMRYYFYTLSPRPLLRADITKPDGKEISLEIKAKVTPGRAVKNLTGDGIFDYIRESENAYQKERRQFIYDNGNLLVWKMPSFSLEPSDVDKIMDKLKERQSLILDLRGNGGGRVDMLLRLIGNFFPENLKVADEKKRKETKEVIAKTRGKNSFNGKLVVLIDSESGSASEVFSRVMQLEKRGMIVGDQSAGAVMESMFYQHETGIDTVAFYGVSVTVADLIMKDGKSLEHIGVTPDEKIMPTAQDLANNRDPVLARAAEILGIRLSPEEAGKLFPKTDKK